MCFRFSLTIDLAHASRMNKMGEVLPSSLTKCCFRFDLVIGCAVYVTAEVYLWAVLSLTSIYSEFKMIQNNETADFENFTRHSSYYETTFGNAPDGITRATIFTQITVNGFLAVAFVLYLVCAVVLLIGISERNLGYFLPYLYLDSVFLYLSLIGILLGLAIQHRSTFRNCTIFAFKFYPSSCIYSLFKKIGGQPITFSNFFSFDHLKPSPGNSNPTIRLAQSDSEFESAQTKNANEFQKPQVSFQDEELRPSSKSEPTIISASASKKPEVSILKPSVQRTLKLPIQKSYP